MKRALKTMIVDDEEIAAELLEIMLNRVCIREIKMAKTGREAINMFAAGLKDGSPYALVFLDILMPEIDGLEVLKQLRSAEEEGDIAAADRAVIIMTTALTTADTMIEALFDGDCNDYLVKPIGPVYLEEMLAKNGLIAEA
jgi:two-component system, chemotaxis family, chemotaxis protein CheY